MQFAWPRRAQLTNGETVAPLPAAGGAGGTAGGPPRKSLSMGALKQGMAPTGPAPVHMKKRPGDVDHKRDGIWLLNLSMLVYWICLGDQWFTVIDVFFSGVQPSELEPLVGNNTDTIDGIVHEGEERDEDLTELKITFRSAEYKSLTNLTYFNFFFFFYI